MRNRCIISTKKWTNRHQNKSNARHIPVVVWGSAWHRPAAETTIMVQRVRNFSAFRILAEFTQDKQAGRQAGSRLLTGQHKHRKRPCMLSAVTDPCAHTHTRCRTAASGENVFHCRSLQIAVWQWLDANSTLPYLILQSSHTHTHTHNNNTHREKLWCALRAPIHRWNSSCDRCLNSEVWPPVVENCVEFREEGRDWFGPVCQFK